ncbi:MAG TPA: mechanosensitive ion channel domain-containing protein [Candidatus Acidoferrales bacterium]|nr:mechanosensitive ion channel domain-containing protein [Candidatus Acidoferrales bacterium]
MGLRHNERVDTNQLNHIFANTGITRFWLHLSPGTHIAVILALALLVHSAVKFIRHVSEWFILKSHARKNPFTFVTEQPKFITLTRLIVSGVTFVIYFLAIGFILTECFQFDLTTYLASASIIGLAVSFGSQNLVADVVTGVTLIFSNAIDVGDLVDLGSMIGRVERIDLRFTKLVNFNNQEIFVPNRNITNVSRFPRGGVYAYADVQLSRTADQAAIVRLIDEIAQGTWKQFQAIVLAKPELGEIEAADPGGWNFLRVKFTIWPGQGSLIETTFRQQMVYAMRTVDPAYADWMVTVTYRAMDAPHLGNHQRRDA